jgi:hypothetical protein
MKKFIPDQAIAEEISFQVYNNRLETAGGKF